LKIAVLALQGAFIEHERMLARLGISSFEIRRRQDLEESFDGLIIPGGESTVMGKLLRELCLFEPIRAKILAGLPVFGTCAGLILLARRVANDERLNFAVMDITARRNAYGRQLGSFNTRADFAGLREIPMVFIRAPYIESAGEKAQVLAEVQGRIVAARQNNLLVTAFHPELSDDFTVHQYFSDMVAGGLCPRVEGLE
jgi:5'-phosphate synthase pdxT subunit